MKTIISDGDIGIGIDMKDVTSVVHAGIPGSKGSFVQEIGRAGRAGETSYSKVVFMSQDTVDQEYMELLNPSTSVDRLFSGAVRSSENDFLDSLRKLTSLSEKKESYYNSVCAILAECEKMKDHRLTGYLKDGKSELEYQKYLYVLFRIGYVYDWYILGRDDKIIRFYVDIEDDVSLKACKKKLVDYISKLGEYPDVAGKVSKAESHQDLIIAYLDWYYEHFLYHHREQLLDMYRFLEQNTEASDEAIQSQLKDYFSINIVRLEGDAAAIKQASIKEIFAITSSQAEVNTISSENIQQALSSEYDPKLDLFLVLREMRDSKPPMMVEERLDRIWNGFAPFEQRELKEQLSRLYGTVNMDYKIHIFNFLELEFGARETIDAIYNYNPEDPIYYAEMARATTVYLWRA